MMSSIRGYPAGSWKVRIYWMKKSSIMVDDAVAKVCDVRVLSMMKPKIC
jgi:hypothetical protein